MLDSQRGEEGSMISWVIVAILVLLGVIAIRMNHLRHRIFIIILITLAIFLYTSTFILKSTHNLDFNSAEGIFEASKVYMGWLANGFTNLKNLAGNAVKMDWRSANGTLFNNTNKTKT